MPQATDLAVAYVDVAHPIRYKGHRETHIDAIYGTRLMWGARRGRDGAQGRRGADAAPHRRVYEVGPAQIEPAGAVPTLKPTVDKAQEGTAGRARPDRQPEQGRPGELRQDQLPAWT